MTLSNNKSFLYECGICGQRTRSTPLDMQLYYKGYMKVFNIDTEEIITRGLSCNAVYDGTTRHDFTRIR